MWPGVRDDEPLLFFFSLGTRFDLTFSLVWEGAGCLTSIFLPIGMGIARPRGIIICGGGTTGRGAIIAMTCGGGTTGRGAIIAMACGGGGIGIEAGFGE